MLRAFLVRYIPLLAAAFICVNVFFVSYISPIRFDDSFNLQVADSLSKYFIYQSSYLPRAIYDQRITTNGPLQYIAALNLRIFGERLGLSISLAVVSLLLLASCFKYSKKTFLAILVLIGTYPALNRLMTSYFGEVCALGFILLGAHFSRSRKLVNGASGNRSAWFYEVVFYGFAISTKLISFVIVPFILFGLYFPEGRLNWRLMLDSVRKIAFIYFGSLSVFILLFYFSSLHSQLILIILGSEPKDFLVSNPGLWNFIKSHFWQQSVASSVSYLDFSAYSKSWMLPLLAASSILLIRNSIGWIPLVLFTVAILAFGNFHERRLFLFIVPIILISSAFMFRSIKFDEISSPMGLVNSIFKKCFFDLSILFLWAYMFIAGIQSNLNSSLIISKCDNVKNSLFQSKDFGNKFVLTDNMREISIALNNSEVPVVTSGWWQYPEVQIAIGKSFYNRMEPAVDLFLKDSPVLFLFDPSNKSWPESSIDMCSEVVLNKPNAVLCLFDRKYTLNHRWGVNTNP